MKILFIFIGLSFFGRGLHAQINDSLLQLANEINIYDYQWDPDTPHRLKSLAYDIKIIEDSLIVIRNSTDTEINRNNERSDKNSKHTFKARIKDVGKIEFLNILRTPKYGNPFYDSKIEIAAVRDSKIFDSIYDDGTKRKTWHIPIHVYDHSDSTKFRQISKLLNDYIAPSKNRRAANCTLDDIHEWSGKKIEAVDNINLQRPIYLNGEICSEPAIQELIASYLKAQNIKGILGYVLINELDKLEVFWTEQNNFFNLIDTKDAIPNYLIKEIGVMNNKQFEELFNILKSQEWQTGRCDGMPRKSYFDIAIKNKLFAESKEK